MHRLRLILWVILAAVPTCGVSVAQVEDQPQITVVHPGVEALRADLLFLIGLTSPEEKVYGEDVDAFLDDFSVGVDTGKPVSIDIESSLEPVNYLFWLTYSNKDNFLFNLDSLGWPPFEQPGQPGFYLIDDPFEQGWLRLLPQQKRAVLALTEPENHQTTKQRVLAAPAPGPVFQSLKELPASAFGGLSNELADEAAQSARRQSFSKIRGDDIEAIEQRPAESNSEFELRKGTWSIIYDELERIYIEAAAANVWSLLDQQNTTLSVSCEGSGLDDTSLAESIAEFGQVPDAFASVQPVPDSVLSGRMNVSVDSLRKQNANKFLDLLAADVNNRIDGSTTLKDGEKQATRSIYDDISSLFRDGFASGNVNGFVEASHDGTEFTMAGAVSAPGAVRLTETLKQLPLARSGNTVELNVATVEEIAIHKISLAEGFVALADQLFGVGREFFVGVGRDQVWMATGPGAAELMKTKIAEASDARTSEMVLSVDVTLAPWMNRLNELANEEEMPQAVEERAAWRENRLRLQQLTESLDGNDQLTISVTHADGKLAGIAQVTQGVLTFVGRQIAKMAKENLEI